MFADKNGGLLDQRSYKEKAVICIFIQRFGRPCSGMYNTDNIIFLGEHYKPGRTLYIFSGSSRLKS